MFSVVKRAAEGCTNGLLERGAEASWGIVGAHGELFAGAAVGLSVAPEVAGVVFGVLLGIAADPGEVAARLS